MRVWKLVANGLWRRRQYQRAASPIGPSVAMWIASGAKAAICAATVRGFGRR